MMLTDLADVLRAAGLTVIEISGWKTRGVNGWHVNGPYGGLVHHTGTPARVSGDYPTLGTVRDGRSNLQGPLAQLGLGRRGTWYVIAAGYCNHAGPVDDPDYSNARAIGVEAENPGGSAPWPATQYASYVKGCAALGKHYGITWRGHKEAAVPHGRKTDPNFDCDAFRKSVAAANLKPTVKEIEMQASDKMDFRDAYLAQRDGPKAVDQTLTVAHGIQRAYNYGSVALRDLAQFSAELSALRAEVAALKAAK